MKYYFYQSYNNCIKIVKHSKALFTLVIKFIPVDLMIHCYAQHRNETLQFKPR